MKRILLDNALESWTMAVYYCDEILKGKATLIYRKNYVSALHNAVELFVKQRMIDCNKHEIINKKQTKSKKLLDKFYGAQNLNEFFATLPVCELNKLFTETYSKISDYTDVLFKEYYQEEKESKIIVDNALELLKKLRNAETHFFIDRYNFLTDIEFKQLHNFMSVFYEILQEYQLLPFWGDGGFEYKKMQFTNEKIEEFSYKDAIINSQFMKELINLVKDNYIITSGESAFEVAYDILNDLGDKFDVDRFSELWVYVEMALYYNVILIEKCDVPEIDQEYKYLRFYY